jgi:hypothetical protein
MGEEGVSNIRPQVYVLYRDYGYEGKAAPFAVTTSFEVAEAWKAGGENAIGKACYSTHTLDFIPEREP